jgi:hypothetical protein
MGQPPSSTGPMGAMGGGRKEPRSYAPRFSFEGVVFPEGITLTSPSVVAHQALASSWAESESFCTNPGVIPHPGFPRTVVDPRCSNRVVSSLGKENMATNAQASLAMFEAARTDGDVDGARSWYQAFSKDNPTAVSLHPVPHPRTVGGRQGTDHEVWFGLVGTG